jgi:hypothetical protein
MELFAEAVSAAGALLLSIACCLLAEELLFGGLVRLFFARSRRPGDGSGEKRGRGAMKTSLRG